MTVAKDRLLTEFAIEGVEDYRNSIAMIRAALKGHKMDVGEASGALKDMGQETIVLRRASNLMRLEWRMEHAAMLEAGRTLNDIRFIGQNVTQMWQAYTIAQMRVADASRDIASSQADVIIIQDALNRARRAGDIESVMNLTLRLSHAQDRVKRSSDELSKAQTQNIIGYAGIGLQVVGLTARLPIMAMHVQVLRGYMIEQTAATVASTVATHGATAADIAHTTAIKAKSAALAVMHALSGPVGWAILAGAAVIGTGYLLSTGGSQQTTTTIVNYSPTVYGGMGGLREDREDLVDSLRRRGG